MARGHFWLPFRRRSVWYDEWRGGIEEGSPPVMFIRNLLSWRGYKLDLHKMVGPDGPQCYHSHPARAFRLIFWGGYLEEIWYGDDKPVKYKIWLPFDCGFVQPDLVHNIAALVGKTSWSLWLRWPKTHEIQLLGKGWENARKPL